MSLKLRVTDASGATYAHAEGPAETWLVYEPAYAAGDRLWVESDEPKRFVVLQLDDALEPALVFLKDGCFAFDIPFGEKHSAYSPRAFFGSCHRLAARFARPEEIVPRRNLAFNPYDYHANTSAWPHVTATVETRGEAPFAARNAIDGQTANNSHGKWPYTSWGTNRDPTATLTLAFGRTVSIDEAVVYLRADFPHDAWWREATLNFSDGSSQVLELNKTGAAQSFRLAPRNVEWVSFGALVKAGDVSAYAALTQIEIWGTESDLLAPVSRMVADTRD